MSTSARFAAAAALALLSAIGIGVVIVHWVDRDPRAAPPLGLRVANAVAPFAGAREVRVAIGDRCARVVLADTSARREHGLRGVDHLGPYAGMLFVQSRDSEVAFTMSGVSAPLEIAWYSANGSRVGSTRMPPCPRSRAECPAYRSPQPYRAALETPPGTASPAHLVPCA